MDWPRLIDTRTKIVLYYFVVYHTKNERNMQINAEQTGTQTHMDSWKYSALALLRAINDRKEKEKKTLSVNGDLFSHSQTMRHVHTVNVRMVAIKRAEIRMNNEKK